MLALGLLPLLCWGLASHQLTSRVLSLRSTQIEDLLARVDSRLGATPSDQELREELSAARLYLLQAELARRSLARLLPRTLLLTLLGSTLLIALAAFVLGRQLARPIEALAAGMNRYARGDLGHRLPVGGREDELQMLMVQFNRMGDELAEQRARLEITEAIAAWQGVARALAHEIKNPLTAMRLSLARLRDDPPRGLATPPGFPVLIAAESPPVPSGPEAARRREALDLVERQIETLLRLAQSFSSFARLPAPEPRETTLRPIVEDACALYRQASPVPVECHAEDVPLRADPGLLGRAIGNLVKNAVEASASGAGPVEVVSAIEGRTLHLEVRDRGAGIREPLEGSALARSLGSTKAEGSGLGLPIAHRIVHEHGGALSLRPREGGGTVAIVTLPLAGEDR